MHLGIPICNVNNSGNVVGFIQNSSLHNAFPMDVVNVLNQLLSCQGLANINHWGSSRDKMFSEVKSVKSIKTKACLVN